MSSNDNRYFGNIEDPYELALAMQEKIKEWRTYCKERGLLNLWSKKLQNYYGNSSDGNSSQTITSGGTEGELSLLKINSFRNLIQNQLTLVVSQRPAGVAVAINSNPTSLKQSKIASSLAEYMMTSKGLEAKFKIAAEKALVVDEGFVDIYWNRTAGTPVAVDSETGLPEMSGDIEVRSHSPWNVSRDPSMSVEMQKWYILSYKINKFDEAITYEKFADKILAVKADSSELSLNYIQEGSDAIFAHLLVHDRTPSVPNGRYALLIGDSIVLDTDLPYREFPIDRISPSDVIDGSLGYSASNDILGLEQATDALTSAVLTNNIVNAVQNFMAPQGVDIQVSDIAKGLRLFEMPESMVGKLQALQLTRSAPETYQLIDKLEQMKKQFLGVNDVTLGNPQAAGMSGASGSALALIQSQAISSNSGLQKSYLRLISSVMTKIISVLRTYADTEQVAFIVGNIKSQGLKEFKFTGKDLNSISSINYEMVNPVSQTVGGRLQTAENLLKSGLIKSAKQYLTVQSTGQIDTLTQDDESDELLILEENERITQGEQVEVVVTEMHQDHIKSHMSVISSVDAKKDPQLVMRTLEHIQKHLDAWSSLSISNPGLLFATGQQPLPQAQQQAPVPPNGQPQLVGSGQQPVVTKAQETRPAQMPTNPATGEKAQVPGVVA